MQLVSSVRCEKYTTEEDRLKQKIKKFDKIKDEISEYFIDLDKTLVELRSKINKKQNNVLKEFIELREEIRKCKWVAQI